MTNIYDNDPITVYCCETALPLFQLDDNTIAYYQQIDPSGKVLERHLTFGYRHPAIRTVKDGYFRLADTCPVVFLCWLMHKFITLPTSIYPLESYDNLIARSVISAQLSDYYDNGQIDDNLYDSIVSTLQAVPFIDDKTDCTIPLQSPSISVPDIEFLLERVRTATAKKDAKDITKAISQYRVSESVHKASKLLYLYWNQSSTGDYKDSPKAKIHKEVSRRIKTITSLDLIDPFGLDGSRFLLSGSSSKPIDKSKAEAASNALSLLASMIITKNNS